MSITILNPGMLTSVQDLGRIGYQQFGVSVSGVMDPRSASIANILVGNDESEAVLECTMMGPHIRFDAPNIIAITGGDLGATLDGQRIDTYRAIPVNAGQTLRFTMLRTGCRAFVAFAGGLDIPVVMGSRSTNMKAKIGGYQGRKLQKDDVIGFRAPKTDSRTSACATPRPSSCRAQNISCASYSARRTMRSPSVASRPFSAAFTLSRRSLTAWAAVLMAS